MKRDYIVYLFSFLIVCFLAFMMFTKSCTTETIKVNTNNVRDSIADLSSKIIKVEQKKDSIVKEIKPLKSISKKKASYFVPQIVNCTFDSTKYLKRIDSLLSLCNKLDTVYQIDSVQIKLLKTQIKQYKNLDTLHLNTIDSLVVEIDKQFKKGYIKGAKHGSIGSTAFWLTLFGLVKK
jgi:hypothetical protein